jgi:hypothetical protein
MLRQIASVVVAVVVGFVFDLFFVGVVVDLAVAAKIS